MLQSFFLIFETVYKKTTLYIFQSSPYYFSKVRRFLSPQMFDVVTKNIIGMVTSYKLKIKNAKFWGSEKTASPFMKVSIRFSPTPFLQNHILESKFNWNYTLIITVILYIFLKSRKWINEFVLLAEEFNMHLLWKQNLRNIVVHVLKFNIMSLGFWIVETGFWVD